MCLDENYRVVRHHMVCCDCRRSCATVLFSRVNGQHVQQSYTFTVSPRFRRVKGRTPCTPDLFFVPLSLIVRGHVQQEVCFEVVQCHHAQRSLDRLDESICLLVDLKRRVRTAEAHSHYGATSHTCVFRACSCGYRSTEYPDAHPMWLNQCNRSTRNSVFAKNPGWRVIA
jgi:hypothetical protein